MTPFHEGVVEFPYVNDEVFLYTPFQKRQHAR